MANEKSIGYYDILFRRKKFPLRRSGKSSIFSGRGKAYLARKTKRIMKHEKYQGTIVSVMFNTKTMSGDERRAPDKTPFRFE